MSSTEIAQRLAEHPRWRPLAGMRLLSPDGWARVDDERLTEWEGWPDLDDPATQGCLLMMLTEAEPSFHALHTGLTAGIGPRQWCVLGARTGEWVESLGEALALALLAAWGEP